jgi:protein-S-isoprenylcysteine O-methyltransferase Ste14
MQAPRSLAFPKTIDTAFILDLFECLLMASLFIRMNVLLLPLWLHNGDFVVSMILFSEGLAAFLIVTHKRAAQTSLSVWEWFITVVATTGPLLVTSSVAAPLVPLQICEVLVVFGFVLQVSAKLALRRSFGLAPANRGVKVSGPYRFLRHPMYAGYATTQVAFFLSHPSWWNLTVYLAAFVAQCGRILAEERLLSRDSAYVGYMSTTRYRIIPFLF